MKKFFIMLCMLLVCSVALADPGNGKQEFEFTEDGQGNVYFEEDGVQYIAKPANTASSCKCGSTKFKFIKDSEHSYWKQCVECGHKVVHFPEKVKVEPTPTPVVTPTPTPVVTPTPTPEITPTPIPTPTPIIEPTPSPAPSPTPSPTPRPAHGYMYVYIYLEPDSIPEGIEYEVNDEGFVTIGRLLIQIQRAASVRPTDPAYTGYVNSEDYRFRNVMYMLRRLERYAPNKGIELGDMDFGELGLRVCQYGAADYVEREVPTWHLDGCYAGD